MQKHSHQHIPRRYSRLTHAHSHIHTRTYPPPFLQRRRQRARDAENSGEEDDEAVPQISSTATNDLSHDLSSSVDSKTKKVDGNKGSFPMFDMANVVHHQPSSASESSADEPRERLERDKDTPAKVWVPLLIVTIVFCVAVYLGMFGDEVSWWQITVGILISFPIAVVTTQVCVYASVLP